jgi:NodT family efflux transporter outer membrane factor (OMF) lipoprotein
MIFARNWHLTGLMALAASTLLISCEVGPNFKKPAPPDAETYSKKPLRNPQATTGITGGGSQRFVQGLDIPAQWWTLFHSKALTDLVESSLAANPSIKAAQDALLVAKENVSAQIGYYYPSVSGGFAASRNKSSIALSPVTNTSSLYYSLYTSSVNVSFVPDVFGLNRRTVESLRAQAEEQRFALEATYITLSSNVVAAAIQEASLRGQIGATRELIDINTKMLDILRKQLATGYASGIDLAQQEAQLAQVVATLPPLLKQLAQQRDLLSALAGRLPSQEPKETFDLASLNLPRELPVSLPSSLVEQRPDVRQAEENLHSASAQVGVAVANRLPTVNLTGNIGTTATAISQLFAPGVGYWTLGAALTQPIFEGGTLLHRVRAARAAYREADEQYRGTVITALQNVADTLHALEQDGEALKAAYDAEHAAKVSLDLTSHQFQTGYANFLALLTAEQAYQQAVINLVQAQANRFSDTAALFQALGGGWWNREEEIPKEPARRLTAIEQ